MTKKVNFRPWVPQIYVVEIWWEHASGAEWLYQEAHLHRTKAKESAKRFRKSGYRFRVAKYVREAA